MTQATLVKGGDDYPDFESALRQAAADASAQEAKGQVVNAVQGGLGLGLLGGGLYGLHRYLSRPDAKLRKRIEPAVAELPVTARRRPKLAVDGLTTPPSPSAAHLEPGGMWWRTPLAVTGAAAAGLGAMGLVGKVRKKFREKDRAAQEDQAKAEFESALADVYRPAAKMASDEPSLRELLEAAFTMAKRAGLDGAMNSLLSGYGTYAGVAGLGAGVLAYKAAAGRKRKALQAALRQRQREQMRSQPVEMVLPKSLQVGPAVTPALEE